MKLFDQLSLNSSILKNCIAMAPMTRSRADSKGIVNELTSLYYSQRASAGLVITEAINISKQAIGSPFTPGIYTSDQIAAWKRVTDSVHKAGGKIVAQLWHTGRVGHSIDREGELPVAPSAIAIRDQEHFTSRGLKPYEVPRALQIFEIRQIVQDYKQAALNAVDADFDAVELHAAFGYLPNQFLVESANHRTDEYGGDIKNRCEFVLQVMQAIVEAVGPGKAAIKLSPSIPFNSIIDSNPTGLYTHLIMELNKIPLAYIHLMNPLFPTEHLPSYPRDVIGTFGLLTDHLLVANGGYTRDTGERELARGIAKMISYGLLFLANPDLPKRFELNAPLNKPDRVTFYGGGAKGYTDYPFLK